MPVSSSRPSHPALHFCPASRSRAAPCRRWSRARDDAGAASVLAAFLIAVVVTVMAGGAVLGSAVAARHRAAAAADLAALSGATALAAGRGTACAIATSVADAMASTVVRCEIDGLDVLVIAEAAPAFGVALVGRATAAARAGPLDTPGFTGP
ncbi:flp pilus-assembly TadE/G-like family protein [Mycolicibacterium sp. 018/SC-01/001]|nr:Rv3654c family TadE-like protein [Mycolicibacterium sp. 018/SC-01/001]TRW80117.1 flp pilus-assembly TadE/G-like family protein [Mycolicibacterium sp. 018/SC-01/001]